MIKAGSRVDILNTKGERNINNIDRQSCNCGGYALETFNWYCPYDKKYDGELFGWCSDYDTEETLEITVNHMLEEFKGDLRKIENVKELEKNEYAIAFRIGNGDFHYAKRNARGIWFHKRGNLERIETMTKEQLFNEDGWGCGRYDSKIVLFAKKKRLLN